MADCDGKMLFEEEGKGNREKGIGNAVATHIRNPLGSPFTHWCYCPEGKRPLPRGAMAAALSCNASFLRGSHCSLSLFPYPFSLYKFQFTNHRTNIGE